MQMHYTKKPIMESVTVGHSSSSRFMHQAKTSSPPRSSRQFLPSKNRGSTSRPKTDKCFNYKGFGHHKSQCPSKFMGIPNKIQSPDDSEWEKPTYEMISECEQELAEVEKKAVKGFTRLMHHMFTI